MGPQRPVWQAGWNDEAEARATATVRSGPAQAVPKLALGSAWGWPGLRVGPVGARHPQPGRRQGGTGKHGQLTAGSACRRRGLRVEQPTAQHHQPAAESGRVCFKGLKGKRRPARLCRVPVPLVFLPSWTCSFLVTSLPPAALLAAAPSPESTCALPAARKADSESGLGAPHSPPQRCAPPPPAPAGRLGRSTAVSRVPSRPWLLSRRCLRFSAVGWLRFVVVVVSVYPLRCPPRSSDA